MVSGPLSISFGWVRDHVVDTDLSKFLVKPSFTAPVAGSVRSKLLVDFYFDHESNLTLHSGSSV
jgi:hypothetical protein